MDSRQEDRFGLILASFYEAALERGGWTSVSCLVNDIIGTRGNCLGFGEGRPWVDEIISFVRICAGGERREDWERRYFESYYRQDERIAHISRLPSGHLLYNEDVYTGAQKMRSPLYNELLREIEAQRGLQMRLDGLAFSQIVWMFADPIEPDGWGTDQIRMIEGLQPHVRQFVRVRQALADAGALGTSVIGLLDRPRIGVIQLDPGGRILAVNDRAQGFLREGGGLYDVRGLLFARARSENLELQRLLAGALPPSSIHGTGGTMTVSRAADSTPLVLHIHPLSGSGRPFGGQQIAALALVLNPASRARIDPGLVALGLRLTATQGELAAMLASGHSLSHIAAATGRTKSTVRWHLQQIFRRLGISRQAELVRRVLSLEGVPESRQETPWSASRIGANAR